MIKEAVVIKSYQNGLNLMLNNEIEFQELINQIKIKFTASRTFFGNAKMVLTFEGRNLTHVQEIEIVNAIKESSDLVILCILGKDEEGEKLFTSALEEFDGKLAEKTGLLYTGNLSDGEIIESEESIVIVGDVNPSCKIISAKNIIVLGGLYGDVHAGTNGEKDAYVVALEMKPERLKIGNIKFKNTKKGFKWGLGRKSQSKIAFVKNEKIVCEILTKEKLVSF